MEIKGKVHCFFEQSGTFKREFIKLGIPAEDYDIQNNFGETDHVTDLFGAIDDAYDGKPTIFDSITSEDLIMAFYPCTYFCQMSQYAQSLNYRNYQHMTESEALDKIIERQNKRNEFLVRLTKFVKVCVDRKLRMIFENPITGSFITNYFLKDPTIKDNNRMLRGDFFVKPTGYWYWNCEPTYGRSYQNDKQKKTRCSDWQRQDHRRTMQRRAQHDFSRLCPQLHLRLHHRQRARVYRTDIVRPIILHSSLFTYSEVTQLFFNNNN